MVVHGETDYTLMQMSMDSMFLLCSRYVTLTVNLGLSCRLFASPTGTSSVAAAGSNAKPLLLVVGVALIDSRSAVPRVLLAQRPPGKANAGLWEFPGGKVGAMGTGLWDW